MHVERLKLHHLRLDENVPINFDPTCFNELHCVGNKLIESAVTDLAPLFDEVSHCSNEGLIDN